MMGDKIELDAAGIEQFANQLSVQLWRWREIDIEPRMLIDPVKSAHLALSASKAVPEVPAEADQIVAWLRGKAVEAHKSDLFLTTASRSTIFNHVADLIAKEFGTAGVFASPPKTYEDGPKVKALEWEERTSPREDGPAETTGDWTGIGILGAGYGVYIFEDHYEVTREDGEFVESHLGDLDEAKAAAQADYEKRILSALIGAPK